MPDCRFGCGPAAARYAMDRGCVCYPDDREQDLCAQHIIRSTPLGSFRLMDKYISDSSWEALFGTGETRPLDA